MDTLLLYYALLVLWVPLLWPLMRLRGWKRGTMFVIVSAGALAAASEIWQAFGEPNAIRLDVIFFSLVLVFLYVAAVAVLLLARWRIAATLVGIVVAIVGGGLWYSWAEVIAETERLASKFDERNRLMFEARFRDRATYDAAFGPFDGGASGRFPAGHWEASGKARFTRLIVNDEGQAWLYYRCGDTECNYRPSNTPLQRAADGALREWRGELRPPAGELLPVRLIQRDDTALVVEARDTQTEMALRPPPIAKDPAPESLDYLGTFSETACVGSSGKHVAVRQVSLWRQGDDVMLAVGVFRTVVAGRRALFVSPTVMGRAQRVGPAWDFDWNIEGEPASAQVDLAGGTAGLTLNLPRGKAEKVVLTPGTIFADDTIDLAPRTTVEDWTHWFDTVWVGHFLSGKAPACPAS